MDDIFVGRQPIYDAGLEVHGYELLFRAGDTATAGVVDGDQATSQVIVNAFIEIGLDQIVGDRLAFLNLTRSFLVRDLSGILPPGRVVLEVLEDIEPDAEVRAGLRRLREQGYQIALDDFLYRESRRPLVELAHLVKIDILDMTPDTLREHVRKLAPYGIPLLAEKVETREAFELCRTLGFRYFQGYFFCRPDVTRGRRMPPSRLAIVRLLSRLQDPDISTRELEELISQDVTLSYKILRYINSAAVALPRQVESIHQAVVYLGLQAIKNWITLLSLAGLEDKPRELLVTAMVRARMCEELARATRQKNGQVFFTVGLFSALDAMMDRSLEELLDDLPLSEGVRQALLHKAGPAGRTLQCVLAYERGDWDAARDAGFDVQTLRGAYLAAVQWARTVSAGLTKT